MSAPQKLSSRTQRRIRLDLAKRRSLALCCDDLNEPSNSAKRLRTSIEVEPDLDHVPVPEQDARPRRDSDETLSDLTVEDDSDRTSSTTSDGTLGGSSSSDLVSDYDIDSSDDQSDIHGCFDYSIVIHT